MSDSITVRNNLPNFSRQMAELRGQARPIVGAATRAAAAQFRNAARLAARRKTGALQRAIIVKRARRTDPGVVAYIVGLRLSGGRLGRRSKGNFQDIFYWRFLEEGWIPRGPGRALKGGNRSRARQRDEALRAGTGKRVQYPFLAPAFQSAQGNALSAFYAKLEEGIVKAGGAR